MAETPWYALIGAGSAPIDKRFSKATPIANPSPGLLYGVELEIENTPNWGDMLVPGIRREADGSLRNNGSEFITEPMTFSNLAYCLQTFFAKNKLTPANYSERCSIHVHTNCLNLTMNQIQTICFVYQMCEKLLYGWVDHERFNNIFCVPWSQTNITYRSLRAKTDAKQWRQWRKYTGLNLLPLYTQGTIEWRHMSGHSNVDKILQWCKIIGAIYAYAEKNKLENIREKLLGLNTSSHYRGMLEEIFGDLAQCFTQNPAYEQQMADGVINMKYAAYEEPPKKPSSILDDLPADGGEELFRRAIEADRANRAEARFVQENPLRRAPALRERVVPGAGQDFVVNWNPVEENR